MVMFNVPLQHNVPWRMIKIEYTRYCSLSFSFDEVIWQKYQFSSNILHLAPPASPDSTKCPAPDLLAYSHQTYLLPT